MNQYTINIELFFPVSEKNQNQSLPHSEEENFSRFTNDDLNPDDENNNFERKPRTNEQTSLVLYPIITIPSHTSKSKVIISL